MAFNNLSSIPMTMSSDSMNEAINFLTKPLLLTRDQDRVPIVRLILKTTLQAAYVPNPAGQLILSFSPSSLPPRPIYAACIASGVQWPVWMSLIATREFDLVIENSSIVVEYIGLYPSTVVVWTNPAAVPLTERKDLLTYLGSQVPISKLGQKLKMQAALRATLDSARVRVQTRTLAQQLMELDHKEEADELFARISNTAIISPTPTREAFVIEAPSAVFRAPSPVSSPEPASSPVSDSSSSRPSSRSSLFSTFSDDESITSASSASSIDFLDSTKPAAIAIKTPMNTFNRRAPVFTPRQRSAPAPSPVVVDNTKKDVTKYLYQGGVSTVLTGGVMLGGAPAARPAAPNASSVPKYRAPVGGRKTFTNQNASSANSWRRPARV